MSRTYDIACVQCKKALWIGQVGGGKDRGHIYSGEACTMAALNEFLWGHADHPLIFTNDQNLDDYDEVQPNDQVQRPSAEGAKVALEPLVGRELLPALVDAFLAWPLPDSVCSDGCVTARGAPHRTGTNLLTADEARQMFEHALAAAVTETRCRICDNTGWNHYAQPGPGPGYKTVRCKCAIGTPNA